MTGGSGSPAAFWDARAAAWAEGEADPRSFWIRRAALAAGLVARHAPDGPVLDVGCGAGGLMALLAGQGRDPLGLDRSPAMIARALAVLAGILPDAAERLRVAEADRVPVDGRFASPMAAIVLLGTLAYVPDAGATLARLAGRLAPGGVVIATGLQRASPFVAGELLQRIARQGPGAARDPVARALLSTGLWSGGGGDPATGRGARALDRAAAEAGLVPVARADLWGPGFGVLDRAPAARGALGRTAARRFAWCPMAVYRRDEAMPSAASGGQSTGNTAGSV
ncbi:MAG: class I SAM-dependent methyltransferase [Azospirillaceae bacterium]